MTFDPGFHRCGVILQTNRSTRPVPFCSWFHVAGHLFQCSEIMLKCKMMEGTSNDEKHHWRVGIGSGMMLLASDAADGQQVA